MFKSIGESADYDEVQQSQSDDELNHEYTSNTGEGKDSPPTPIRKMYWHSSCRIERVQELVPEEIRWFYKEDVKSKWIPFIGYDSLRIECRFRALEYAKANSSDLTNLHVDNHIHVRGGLYEVEITQTMMHPVYWKGESLPILRGTWFVDGTWQPLEYEYSQQIELDHLARFKGLLIPAPAPVSEKRGNAQALHNRQFREFHVDWYDITEVYLFSEATSSRWWRSFTNKLGVKKAGMGTRLYRGYVEEAKMDDKPAEVTHLVFVIHGVGQKYNNNRIIRCCNDLRNGSFKLLPKFFPELSKSHHRIEFLPVEWRSELQLDGDVVESITPEKLRNLRVILNATAMDILYYTSPLYRCEIIHGLESELNRLYSMFCERHPYFEANNGKVSVCGHSLGCVITYDILTGWDPIELYDSYVCNAVREASRTTLGLSLNADQLSNTERSKKLHEFYVKSIVHKQQSTLKFKVTNFFALGSPLGVFLALRGISPQPNGLINHILPRALCERFFNIYHPTDPVAYRIEPLVLKHYSTIAPLKIHYVDDPNKTPYSEIKSKAYAAFTGKSPDKDSKKKPRKSAMAHSDVGSSSSQTVSSVDSYQSNLSCKTRDQDIAVKEVRVGSVNSPDTLRGVAAREHNSANGGTPADVRYALTGVVKGLFSRFGLKKTVEERLAAELEACETSDEEYVDRDEPDLVEHTDLEHRLDYALPCGRMSNNYVAAIFTHTSYWSNPEVAMFILSQIFPEYGPVG